MYTFTDSATGISIYPYICPYAHLCQLFVTAFLLLNGLI